MLSSSLRLVRLNSGLVRHDPAWLGLVRSGQTQSGMVRLKSARYDGPLYDVAASNPAQKNLIACTEESRRLHGRIEMPDYFTAALNKKALTTFEGFSLSNRRDYVEWLTEAKREETREKRLRTAIEWMAAGKPRNWKYLKEWR
jgi:hypothetical protein